MKIFWREALLLPLILMTVACQSAPKRSISKAHTPSSSPIETSTASPVFTSTPSPASTDLPLIPVTGAQTPTPEWLWHEPGSVEVPILLYHHISDEEPLSRYYVSLEDFENQMQSLQEWGYTTIPMSLLLETISDGAKLPPRPIVITADDGHYSVFENAYPIMRNFDFFGVNYIVAERMGFTHFLGENELRKMRRSDWEIGAHSMTHADLTQNHSSAREEILNARLALEAVMSRKVETFAYPFGAIDSFVVQKVSEYGYVAAAGLGKGCVQGLDNLFYLSRIEVYGNTDLNGFADLLPWSENP